MKPARLGIYADVQEVLDAALVAGGGTYACESSGEAIHWRQRAYKFRKLYAETVGFSPYDKLVLPRIRGTEVEIRLRRQVGRFVPSSLPILPEPKKPKIEEDDLFAEASRLARELGDEL
jgi:hypothetical protein